MAVAVRAGNGRVVRVMRVAVVTVVMPVCVFVFCRVMDVVVAVAFRQVQHDARHHQPGCGQQPPAGAALAQRKSQHCTHKGRKGKHRPRARGAKGALRQQVKTQAQAIAGGAHQQQRQCRPEARHRLTQQQRQQRGGGGPECALGQHHLAGVARGHAARQGVVHAPGCGGGQHCQQAQQRTCTDCAHVGHQHHAAQRQQRQRRNDAAVQRLAVPQARQHGREHGLQRQHQRRAGAAGVLQPPGQRHRADDGTEQRHPRQPWRVAALHARFGVRRAPQPGADQGRARIQQRGRREAADAGAKALHQRRAGTEQQRRRQGREAAAQGGPLGGEGHDLSVPQTARCSRRLTGIARACAFCVCRNGCRR